MSAILRDVALRIDNGDPLPGGLNIEVQTIDVGSLNGREPDPAWSFVDHNGHWHGYDGKLRTPTLDERRTTVACTDPDHVEWHNRDDDDFDPDDCGEYVEVHLECAICGAVVTPGTRLVGPKSVPGRMSITAEVPVQMQHGTAVSVVATIDDEVVAFGIAQPVSHRGETGPGGVSHTTTLAFTRAGLRDRKPKRGPKLRHTCGRDCAACDVEDEAAAKRREDRS
jgi:hypothetical protein